MGMGELVLFTTFLALTVGARRSELCGEYLLNITLFIFTIRVFLNIFYFMIVFIYFYYIAGTVMMTVDLICVLATLVLYVFWHVNFIREKNMGLHRK